MPPTRARALVEATDPPQYCVSRWSCIARSISSFVITFIEGASVQRRPPWTCQTSQETTTTGGNRCWAEARFQLNRWPILKPAGKVACGRLVPALPRNLSQPRVTFPKDQHAHFQACRKSGVWTAHPGSSAATSPFQEANSSAAVSSSQATNSSAAPGYDFASQEFDYTGGLGNGDSEPAVATVKEAPVGGKKTC